MLEEFFENTNIIDIRRTGASEMSIMLGHNNEETEYELHIESMVRITKDNRIILSQIDSWSLPEVEDKEGLKVMYDIILRDEIQPLLPLKVLKATFDEIGDVELMLENDISLKVFSDINVPFGLENWMINDNVRHNQYVFENHELGMTGLIDGFKCTVKYNEMHIDFDKPFEHQLENLTEECHALQALVAKIETAERIISNNDK